MSSAQDRPTGRQTGRAGTRTGDPGATGAHSAGGYQGEQQSGGVTGQYPSESVDYGATGQYPSESARYAPAEGRRAGGRMPARHLGLASALLMLSGLLTFFAGITGIIKGSFYATVPNYPFYFSIRSWGITELVIGAVVFAVGVCLLLGMQWARYVAIVIASLSLIASFMFLPFYPIWSIVVIALDIFIIYECAREDPRRRQYA